MLQNDLSKEQVYQMADSLKSKFPYHSEENRTLIKKGLILYRQGSVYNVKMNRGKVEGRVQDVTPVDVVLDLVSVENSKCSCRAPKFCRHQMALFFSMYTSFDRIGALLEEWKQDTPAPISLQRFKQSNEEKDYKDYSLQSWYSYFQQEYQRFLVNYPVRNHFFFPTIYHTFYQGLRRKAPLVQEVKRLFHIHAALFCIDRSLELVEELNLKNYQMDTYVKPYFHNFTYIVFENCIQLRQTSLPFSIDTILEESIERFRDVLLQQSYFPFERIQMYRMIWSSLLHRKKWIEVEETFLLDLKKTPHFSDEHRLALAHLAYLQKEDEKALSILRGMKNDALPYSLWWIGHLTEMKDWKRARLWVDYSLEHVAPFIFGLPSYDGRRHLTRTYLAEISDYANEVDESVLLTAMNKLLPYSYYEYDTYLQENEDFYKWVELQILVGYDIDECDRYMIRTIEKQQRDALLPYYHNTVMVAIEQKNRPSYKKAVKYLKKLRTTYKKMKKEDMWENYITKLAASHKRLRAFQEELTRAALISKE